MMRLEMKKYKTILTEKQQKYLPFTKGILPSNSSRTMEQANLHILLHEKLWKNKWKNRLMLQSS